MKALDDIGSGLAEIVAEKFEGAKNAELFLVVAHRLRHSVGEQSQRVSLFERDNPPGRVGNVGEHAEGGTHAFQDVSGTQCETLRAGA